MWSCQGSSNDGTENVLSLLQIALKLPRPRDKVIRPRSISDDLIRLKEMSATSLPRNNASSTQVRRFHARSERISGAAYGTCLLDTDTTRRVRADEPVPRRVAASWKSSLCLATDHAASVSILRFVYLSIRDLAPSQLRGKGVEGSLNLPADNLCSTSFHQKFVSDSSPAPRHIRDDQRSKRSASLPTTTPLNTNRLKEVPLSTKTPLRGIGLCNVQETNFPYKWTSSTYFSTPANMAEVVSDEAVVQPLQLGRG